MVEVQTLIFLGHEATYHTNDNYLSAPTQLSVKQAGSQVESFTSKCTFFNCAQSSEAKIQTDFKRLSLQKGCILSRCCHVSHVPSVSFRGQLQRKGLSPALCFNKIKVVKGVSCVSRSAPSVPNVLHVATEISVGGRLQSFWQVWQRLGSNPRVVSILKEGYTLPFKERPPLSHFPLIVSKYGNPLKSKSLLEALFSLIQKQAVERVVVKSSLAFYNHLFLVPKPNRKWRPILDLSKLNLFLETGTFKMETPETIRLSLQRGE